MKENVHQCLHSILKIGLTCSMESPKERTDIKDDKLHLIKDVFLGDGIHGSSPIQCSFQVMYIN
jgi:hypothetical protein